LKLSPADIKQQEFKRTLRGYNVQEVSAFLEIVAEKYHELAEENRLLIEAEQKHIGETEALKRQIVEHERTISELRSELIKVDHLMDSRVDSEIVLQKTDSEAEKILNEARAKVDELKSELAFLQEQRTKVNQHLREYLQSQLSLLGTLAESPNLKASGADGSVDGAESVKIAFPQLDETEEVKMEAKSGETESEIEAFLTEARMDDIPDEIVEEIRRDITEFSDLKSDVGAIEKKRQQVLSELDAVSQNKTSRFRKSDFQKMLGDDAFKKSEELINQIYEQLEKKRSSEGQ